jgi:hypothetical protein
MTTLTRSAICLVLAALAGCQRPDIAVMPNVPQIDGYATLSLYLDPETGCQYIGQRSSNAGITPRIAADGKTHMGCKGVKP